ncbi:transposase [Chryseobacterium sp.]|uniref:transposase n=1 Tax=Chryseobacterium sp. TaxID=1871047 RepID=UPI0024E1B11C|nr:transposase [Chryseobacterium sp.]
MENLKEIHIGDLLYKGVKEEDIDINRICKFLKVTEKEVLQMYAAKTLDTDTLLRWCKLLEYDFFRLYSSHLILYAPVARVNNKNEKKQMPQFRKSLYTKEIINYILELINTEKKTTLEIINEYRIPKTTLSKWIRKYKK